MKNYRIKREPDASDSSRILHFSFRPQKSPPYGNEIRSTHPRLFHHTKTSSRRRELAFPFSISIPYPVPRAMRGLLHHCCCDGSCHYCCGLIVLDALRFLFWCKWCELAILVSRTVLWLNAVTYYDVTSEVS